MTVKVGIIGMGFMGRMHLSAYRKLPDAEVIAFADTDQDRARRTRRRGRQSRRYRLCSSDVKSFQHGLRLRASS